MKSLSPFIIAVAILITSNCKKENTGPAGPTEANLVGDWVYNDAATGETVIYSLYADSTYEFADLPDAGEAYFEEGIWILTNGNVIFTPVICTDILDNQVTCDPVETLAVTVSGNTMTLSSGGVTVTFQKAS